MPLVLEPENPHAPRVEGRAVENVRSVKGRNRIPAPPAMAVGISPATPVWGMGRTREKSALPVKGKGKENAPVVPEMERCAVPIAAGKEGKRARSARARPESIVSSVMGKENTPDPLVPGEPIHYNPPLHKISTGSHTA